MIKQYIPLIDIEIDIYSKIMLQNRDLLNHINSDDFKLFEQKVYNKSKLFEQIQNVDNELDQLWKNWDKYKSYADDSDKAKIKHLRELIKENLDIENILIDQFSKLKDSLKSKTINANIGKQVLNAYGSKKANLPYFVNKKS